MTNDATTALPTTQLLLHAGLDRALAWESGGSVRYLVAALSASGEVLSRDTTPALNLALAIDISGSMAGAKIDAARQAALAVAEALSARDRLSIVAFDNRTELLLDACPMDAAGHAAARAAIGPLAVRGGTNLFDGWLLAAERVALAMEAAPQASHRVLLLSDGQTNAGLTDRIEIAQHVGALLERGVVTSAVGIGDGYDEELLGAMAEAGGGTLHDAADAPEIGEVVLGELQEGRAALIERAQLRIDVPVGLRAELVGAWAHTMPEGAVQVVVGSLGAGQVKRVVLRLHCAPGAAGTSLLLGVSAGGVAANGGAELAAGPAHLALRLARAGDNTAQPRDTALGLAVVQAWQAEALRRAVQMNRQREGRAARHFLQRELRWMEPYARGIPGAEALVRDLVLVQRQVDRDWGERTRKDVFVAASKVLRSEDDLRAAPRPSLTERFGGQG